MVISPSRVQEARQRLAAPHDERWQQEVEEMQATQDLDQIDDDVEKAATLLEWSADEHTHQPKGAIWYLGLGVVTTALIGLFVIMSNFLAAIVVALAGGLFFFIGRRKPKQVRYRLMVDGIALNTVLYQYKELTAFNIVYEPGDTKVVLVQGRRTLAPLIAMEIGTADPVAIRDVLLEFLPEDQNLEEPFADVLARRLGW